MRAAPLQLLLLLALSLLPRGAQGLHLITELLPPPPPERTLVVRRAPPAEAVERAGRMAALEAALDDDRQRLEERLSASREPPLAHRAARRRRCFAALPESEDAAMAVGDAAGHPRTHQGMRVANIKEPGPIAAVRKVDKEEDDEGDVKRSVPRRASTSNPRHAVTHGSIPPRHLQVLLSMKEDLLRERLRTPEAVRESAALLRGSLNAPGRIGVPLARRASPIFLPLLVKGFALPAVRMAKEKSIRTSSACPAKPQSISDRNRANSVARGADIKLVSGHGLTSRAALVTDQQIEESEEENNDDEMAAESTFASSTQKITTPQTNFEGDVELSTFPKTTLLLRKLRSHIRKIPSDYAYQRQSKLSNTQEFVRAETGDSPLRFGNAYHHQIAHIDEVIGGLMALQAQRRSGDTADHLAPRHELLHHHHLMGIQLEPSHDGKPLDKSRSGGRTPSQFTKLAHHSSDKIENTYENVIPQREKTRGDVPRYRIKIMPSMQQQSAYEPEEDTRGTTSMLYENKKNNGNVVKFGAHNFQLREPSNDSMRHHEEASHESERKLIILSLKPTKEESEKDTSGDNKSGIETQDKAISILPSHLGHKQLIGNNYHPLTTEDLPREKSLRIYSLASRPDIRVDNDINTSPQSLISTHEKLDNGIGEPDSLMTASFNRPRGNRVNEKGIDAPEVRMEGEGSLTILSFNIHPVVVQKATDNAKHSFTENAPSLAPSKEKIRKIVSPEARLLLHSIIKNSVEDNAVDSTLKCNEGLKSIKHNHQHNELHGTGLHKYTNKNIHLRDDTGRLQNWMSNSRQRYSDIEGITEKKIVQKLHEYGEDNTKRLVFPAPFSANHERSNQINKEKNCDFSSLVTAKSNRFGQSGSSLHEGKLGLISTGGMEVKKIKLGNGKSNKQSRKIQTETQEKSTNLVDSKGDNLDSISAPNLRKGTIKDNYAEPLQRIAKVSNFKADEQAIIMYNRNLMPLALAKRDDSKLSKGDQNERTLVSQSTPFVQNNYNFGEMAHDTVKSEDSEKKITEMETKRSNSNEYPSSRLPNQPNPDTSHHVIRDGFLPSSLKEKTFTIVGVPNIIHQMTSTETTSTRETKNSGIKEQSGFRIPNEINLKNSDPLEESKMSASAFIQTAKESPGKLNDKLSNQKALNVESNFDDENSVSTSNAVQSLTSKSQSDTTQVPATNNNPQDNLEARKPTNVEHQGQKQTDEFSVRFTSSPSSTSSYNIPGLSTKNKNSGSNKCNVKDMTHKVSLIRRKGHSKGTLRREGSHGASCRVSIYLEDPKNIPEDEMSVRTASDKPSHLVTTTAFEVEDNESPCARKTHVVRERKGHEIKTKNAAQAQQLFQSETDVANSEGEMEPAVNDVLETPRRFTYETQQTKEPLTVMKPRVDREEISKREDSSGNLIRIKEDRDRKGISSSAQQQNAKQPAGGACALIAQPENVQRLLNAQAARGQRHPPPEDEDEDMEDAERENPPQSRKPSTALVLPATPKKGNGTARQSSDERRRQGGDGG